MGREFYINKQSSGCDAVGWIMVSTQRSCFYERTSAAKPTFLYSKATTADSWSTSVLLRDSLVDFGTADRQAKLTVPPDSPRMTDERLGDRETKGWR